MKSAAHRDCIMKLRRLCDLYAISCWLRLQWGIEKTVMCVQSAADSDCSERLTGLCDLCAIDCWLRLQWEIEKTVWSVCNRLLTQTAVRDWEDCVICMQCSEMFRRLCDLYAISCWLRLQWGIEKTVWSVCNQLLTPTAVGDWEDCVICVQSAADWVTVLYMYTQYAPDWDWKQVRCVCCTLWSAADWIWRREECPTTSCVSYCLKSPHGSSACLPSPLEPFLQYSFPPAVKLIFTLLARYSEHICCFIALLNISSTPLLLWQSSVFIKSLSLKSLSIYYCQQYHITDFRGLG